MTTTYMQRMRAIPRDAWLSMVGMVVAYLNYFGVSGVLFNLYLLRMGYDARFVGLVNAALLAALAAGAPLGAVLGRRWGCRRPMIWGMIAATIGSTLVALGDLLPAPVRAIWLVSTYSLVGLGIMVYANLGTVYIRAVCGDAGCDHAFAMRSAAGPMAGFLGALLGGFLPGWIAPALGVTLQDPAPYRWPLLGAGLLVSLSVAALLPIHDVAASSAPSDDARTRASPLPWVPIAVLMLVMLLRWVGNGPPSTFMNVYLDAGLGAGTATIGLVRGLGQILGVPAALLVPLATARWSRAGVLVAGSFAMGLALLALALAPSVAVAAACFVLTPVLFAFTTPVVPGYEMSLVPVEWAGVMVAMATFSSNTAQAGMALGGGYLIHSFGYVELFLISAGGAVAAGVVLWAYERARRRTPTSPGEPAAARA